MKQEEIIKLAEKQFPVFRHHDKNQLYMIQVRRNAFMIGFKKALEYFEENRCDCWGNIVCSNCSKKGY